MVVATRGINHRNRHLMEDLKKLMPHHRPESKIERCKSLQVVNEICEARHCNKCILFEGRRKQDLYLWMSNVSSGPSVKFLIENSKSLFIFSFKNIFLQINEILNKHFFSSHDGRTSNDRKLSPRIETSALI